MSVLWLWWDFCAKNEFAWLTVNSRGADLANRKNDEVLFYSSVSLTATLN